ncbi:hypothetical protein [Altericroceibacterium xinjiangense]|uniref:hypothetical protein n=1 Tax=Altericroceibacterium xinjiangense TaxID=762261 RepID=UPI0013DEF24C|nr:hypothetical protein [Altericroceibacterium xinjiangense]
MHPRLYRLTEGLHRIDRSLRLAQLRSPMNRSEIARLQDAKRRAKHLINRFLLRVACG